MQQLNGSTMLEVLIGMVIIGAVFAVGALIYSNLVNAELNQHRVRARIEMGNKMSSAIVSKDLQPDQWEVAGVEYTKTVKVSEQHELVSVIKITATTASGTPIGEVKQMVLNE